MYTIYHYNHFKDEEPHIRENKEVRALKTQQAALLKRIEALQEEVEKISQKLEALKSCSKNKETVIFLQPNEFIFLEKEEC